MSGLELRITILVVAMVTSAAALMFQPPAPVMASAHWVARLRLRLWLLNVVTAGMLWLLLIAVYLIQLREGLS